MARWTIALKTSLLSSLTCFLLVCSAKALFEDHCYDDLGCFPLTLDFFNYPNRIVNAYPEKPNKISTTLHLFTRNNPTRSNVISRHDNTSSILASNFNPNKKIKIIIHGYQSSTKASWTKVMRAAFLKVEDFNIIACDWSKGASGTSYIQATANTRVVGAEIATFLQFLEENFDVQLKDVHLIGHSLGAHVAGYAGHWFKTTQIGRITGLDPAQPFFNEMPPTVRLDKNDATFVDIIHTNSELIFNVGPGLYKPVGHIDFYPDGGKSVRSCEFPAMISSIVYNGFSAIDILSCSHGRATWLFIESILSYKCPYLAHACDSFESYLAGKCVSCGKNGEDCQRMGYFARPDPATFGKSYYLTSGEYPTHYCRYHWVVKVEISDKQYVREVTGDLFISLYGSISEVDNIMINSQPINFVPGETYQFLVGMHEDPGNIECIDFSWSEHFNLFEIMEHYFYPIPEQILQVDSIIVEPIDIKDESLRANRTVKFCSPPSNDGLDSKGVLQMLPEYCNMENGTSTFTNKRNSNTH